MPPWGPGPRAGRGQQSLQPHGTWKEGPPWRTEADIWHRNEALAFGASVGAERLVSTLHGPSSSPKPLTHYNRVHKAQPQVGTLAGDSGDRGAGAWFPGQRMGSSGQSPQSSGLRKEAAPAGPPASPEPVATDRSGDRPRHGHITSAYGMDTVAEARGRGPQNTRETEVPLRPPRRHRHIDGGDRSFWSSACPTLLEPPAPKDVASLRVPLKRRVWQAQQRHRHRPAAKNCGRQQFGIKTVSSMEMAFTSAFPLLLSRPGAPSDPT